MMLFVSLLLSCCLQAATAADSVVIPGSDAAVNLLGRVNTQRFEACPSTTRADTGGTCSVLPCDSWRGPGVSCVSGKCVCPAGQCVSWKGECTLEGAVGFDWPASGVSFLVEGTGSVDVLLNGDGADFVVEINNASPGRRFSTTADTSEMHTLANFTSSERRLVTLMRATEYTTKGTVLQRIMLRGNTSLVPPSRPAISPPTEKAGPLLHLEFFGDSDTAGYCILGTPSSLGTQQYEDATQGYARRIADGLGASSYHIEAISGLGVFQNAFACGSKVMPAYWNQTLQVDATAKGEWDFSRYTPTAVVVYLGSNDWAAVTDPPRSDFRQSYRAMLDAMIASYRPSSPRPPAIINVCGGWSKARQEPCPDILNVTQTLQKDGFPHTYYVEVPGNLTLKEDLGCMNHRNVQGQVKVANYLLPRFKAILRMHADA